MISHARDFKARLLALAPYFEKEIWDGDIVRQIPFEFREGEPSHLFPPPFSDSSQDLSLGINPLSDPSGEAHLEIHTGPLPSQRSSPNCVWYSSRLAARRHLIYYACTILSNMLLRRLEANYDTEGYEDPTYDSTFLSAINEYRQKSYHRPVHTFRPSESEVDLNRVKGPFEESVNQQIMSFVDQVRANTPNPDLEPLSVDGWNQYKHTTQELRSVAPQSALVDAPGLTPLLPPSWQYPTPPAVDVQAAQWPEAFKCSYLQDTVTPGPSLEPSYIESPTFPDNDAMFPSRPIFDNPTMVQELYNINQSPIPQPDFGSDFTDFLTTESPTISNFLHPPIVNSPTSHDQPPHDFLTSPNVSPSLQNIYLLSLILRSYPYGARDAPLGAIYLMFPFQVASATADPDQKAWIAEVLNEMYKEIPISFTVRDLEVIMAIFTGIF